MQVRFDYYNPEGETESVVYDHHDLALTSGYLGNPSRVVMHQINTIGRFLRAHSAHIHKEVVQFDETSGSDMPNQTGAGRSYTDSALGETVRS